MLPFPAFRANRKQTKRNDIQANAIGDITRATMSDHELCNGVETFTSISLNIPEQSCLRCLHWIMEMTYSRSAVTESVPLSSFYTDLECKPFSSLFEVNALIDIAKATGH